MKILPLTSPSKITSPSVTSYSFTQYFIHLLTLQRILSFKCVQDAVDKIYLAPHSIGDMNINQVIHFMTVTVISITEVYMML